MASLGAARGPSAPPELPERVRRLLSALILEYIERGEPVSSQWLAGHAGCTVSSATVRHVLARLEEQGFVRQPHTSAGRVPTDLAYRYYVDGLLSGRRPARSAPEIEAKLRRADSVSAMLERVSHELSRVSHSVGFAMAPGGDETLRRIEFVPLEADRILVVVVSTGGRVSHKVITFPESVTRDELVQSANYLSSEFAGMTIEQARHAVLRRLDAERVLYDELLSRSLKLALSTLESVEADDLVFVSGTPFLVDEGLTEQIPVLRALLAMIEEKHRLVRLLTAYIDSKGVKVVIGTEHHTPDLQSLSLIAATYTDGQRTGTVGILGPTRMRYSRAISAVDSVSQAMSRLLAES
jgi:heat-inducible transcriptional repressor